jgi:hypothetical protein
MCQATLLADLHFRQYADQNVFDRPRRCQVEVGAVLEADQAGSSRAAVP